MASTTGTRTLVVFGIKDNGDAPFVCNNAYLDFTSGTPTNATAGLHTGLITGILAGTSLISVCITAVTTIEASCTVTVPAA